MIASKLSLVVAALVLGITSCVRAAPSGYRADLGTRSFGDDDLNLVFARDSADSATPVRDIEPTPKHAKGKKMNGKTPQVKAAVTQGGNPWHGKVKHTVSKQPHSRVQHRHVNLGSPGAKEVTTQDLAEEADPSPPSRLSKRLPPFPSKHHCPKCGSKSKQKGKAGYCKDHQWVCDSHSGRAWVQMKNENCQVCGKSPPKRKRSVRAMLV